MDCASVFGRHEFVIRRLHSLLGLIPIGGYLVFHLATNAAIIDGLETYQHRADQIHRLGSTTILMLEWPIIFLPILFHGVIGMMIVCRGKRNMANYPFSGNVRYTLQRVTGVIAMAFILWHVFHMHGWLRAGWWVDNVTEPLGGSRFDPESVRTAPEAIRASWWIVAFYAVGTLACVYHLANGLWTMGITWGVWTSPRAQRAANVPCALVGVFLATVGTAALVWMVTVDLPPTAEELENAMDPEVVQALERSEPPTTENAQRNNFPTSSDFPEGRRGARPGESPSNSFTSPKKVI
ncbi:MAG: succinate dehydrogenase cytochrome b558 subunit [Planctomycetota bacterium]|jgi:succinate dehydrogenase / fumarate reductase cytochrome b subunit